MKMKMKYVKVTHNERKIIVRDKKKRKITDKEFLALIKKNKKKYANDLKYLEDK